MKVSKLLKEIDKKSREKYESIEMLDEMKTDVLVKAKHQKIYLSIFAASLVLIIIAASLICIYCLPKETRYYAHNEIFESATLEEINENNKEFNITELEDYRIIYEKTIDKESRNLLSYIVTMIDDNDLTELQIRILVNENFVYASNSDLLSDSAIYDGFSMKYIESIENDEGLYSYNSRGFIQKNKERIYLIYSGFGFEEDSGFIKLIGQILNSK